MKHGFKHYYSGTSGLLLPVPNKTFYPPHFQDKSRLTYYASLNNSIEINSSFYRIPLARTIINWSKDVNADFKFTFKLFKDITHQKGLIFDPRLLTQFFSVIDHVEDKKACVLVQLPPSITLSYFANIRELMLTIKENDLANTWKIAFEFRHRSLYCKEIYELLAEFNFGMVIHDKANVQSPLVAGNTDFVYLRFHGPEGNYRGTYADDVLSEYATYINDWLSEDKTVFVYFNNTMGNVHSNLTVLKQYL